MGHIHSGLFEGNGNGISWHQLVGWDRWPFSQNHFDSTHVIVLAEFDEANCSSGGARRTAPGGLGERIGTRRAASRRRWHEEMNQ